MNPHFSDDLENEEIIFEDLPEMIVKRALDYPKVQSKELYYPGKSYCIAVTYAKLLEIHFKEDFISCLDDPDLLFNNDPYFRPYSSDKNVYDQIISGYDWKVLEDHSLTSVNFQKSLSYFFEEFLLKDL